MLTSQILIMKKKPTQAKKLEKIESQHLRALAKKITKVPISINIPIPYRDFFKKDKLTEEKK